MNRSRRSRPIALIAASLLGGFSVFSSPGVASEAGPSPLWPLEVAPWQPPQDRPTLHELEPDLPVVMTHRDEFADGRIEWVHTLEPGYLSARAERLRAEREALHAAGGEGGELGESGGLGSSGDASLSGGASAEPGQTRVLAVSATVVPPGDSEGYPGTGMGEAVTHVRWQAQGPDGLVHGEGWSTLDFRLLAPLPGWRTAEGDTVMLLMGIGEQDAGAGEGPWQAELATARAARLADGTPRWLGDAGDQSSGAATAANTADLRELHSLAVGHMPQLAKAAEQHRDNAQAHAAWQAEQAAKPRESVRYVSPESFSFGPHNRGASPGDSSWQGPRRIVEEPSNEGSEP